MKARTKWILGIVIGLVAVAVIVAASFFIVGRWNWSGGKVEARAVQGWGNGRDMPRQFTPPQGAPQQQTPRKGAPQQWMPNRRMPMRPYGRFSHRSFGGFFPFGIIVFGLFRLGVLALAIYGAVALVRNLRRPKQPAVSPPSAMAEEQSAPPELHEPEQDVPPQDVAD